MVSAERVAAAAGPAQPFMTPDLVVAVAGGRSSEDRSSLTRRSRVRRRNSRRDEDSSSDILSTSGDISSSQLFVQIPPTETYTGSSPKSLSALESGAPAAPPRPPRSPRRLQTAPVSGNKEENPEVRRGLRQRTRSVDRTATRPTIDDIRGRQTRSENGQVGRVQRPRGGSLPRQTFRSTSFSDSSEQPSPLTPNALSDVYQIPVFAQNRPFHHRPRDSGVTQRSTASSSLYPKSTSTEGSYSSLPSLPAQDMDNCRILAVDPADDSHLDALHEMDTDEVSYRLRLLMQNTYYLPPAHSKPFNEQPAADIPKKSPIKSSSPTFFDLFKTVKKKGTASADVKAISAPSAPILRTTSDSSTLSGLLLPQQSPGHTHHLRANRSLPQVRQEPKGRVVVVRERMDDLASIAKQVEQELKARETERRQNASETSHSERVLAQFVDPTDSIDLPSVRSNEFFGPQAALLRGMGIDSSIGAALLADQLPPMSPASWSAESEDVAWRKAILHAAVDHSLNNSSVETSTRSITSSSPRALELPSPPTHSTSSSIMSSHSPSPQVADEAGQSDNPSAQEAQKGPVIGEPILSRVMDEVANIEAMAPSDVEPLNYPGTLQVPNERERPQTLLATTEPVRASSPTLPTMPLRPPPRRPSQTPLNSGGSGSDNAQEKGDQAEDTQLEVGAGCHQAQREGPLRLSDAYETHVGLSGAFGKLTPPGSQRASTTLSSARPDPRTSSGLSESISTTSGSHYSDEGEFSNFHTPQENMFASTFLGSRPSLGSVSVTRESCESSQPSPSTSAFRDAYDRSHYSDSSASLSDVNTLGGNPRGPSRISNMNDPRYAVVRPPPRVSSMLARNPSSRAHRVEQSESGTPMALHVPRLTVQDLLAHASHSSPYSASPISFFDAVEMQSRHDEEEESSESDNDDGEEPSTRLDARDDAPVMSSHVSAYHSDSGHMFETDARISSTQSLVHDPRHALGAFTQQRNASLPQLGVHAASGERITGVGFDALDRWRAISNMPQSASRSTYWHKKHGKHQEIFPHPPRLSDSTADWVKHEQAKEAIADPKRPYTAGSRILDNEGHSRNEHQDVQDPSVRRLDGLLVKHMEREKEVLKRITTSLSKTST